VVRVTHDRGAWTDDATPHASGGGHHQKQRQNTNCNVCACMWLNSAIVCTCASPTACARHSHTLPNYKSRFRKGFDRRHLTPKQNRTHSSASEASVSCENTIRCACVTRAREVGRVVVPRAQGIERGVEGWSVGRSVGRWKTTELENMILATTQTTKRAVVGCLRAPRDQREMLTEARRMHVSRLSHARGLNRRDGTSPRQGREGEKRRRGHTNTSPSLVGEID